MIIRFVGGPMDGAILGDSPNPNLPAYYFTEVSEWRIRSMGGEVLSPTLDAKIIKQRPATVAMYQLSTDKGEGRYSFGGFLPVDEFEELKDDCEVLLNAFARFNADSDNPEWG